MHAEVLPQIVLDAPAPVDALALSLDLRVCELAELAVVVDHHCGVVLRLPDRGAHRNRIPRVIPHGDHTVGPAVVGQKDGAALQSVLVDHVEAVTALTVVIRRGCGGREQYRRSGRDPESGRTDGDRLCDVDQSEPFSSLLSYRALGWLPEPLGTRTRVLLTDPRCRTYDSDCRRRLGKPPTSGEVVGVTAGVIRHGGAIIRSAICPRRHSLRRSHRPHDKGGRRSAIASGRTAVAAVRNALAAPSGRTPGIPG